MKALDFAGGLPAGLGHEPCAAIWRWMATPNFEVLRFIELVKECGLPACWLEFTGDKFFSRNHEKHLLGKITFYHGKENRNGDKVSHHRVIDASAEEGKRFHDIKTAWGEDLVAFHHRLLSQELAECNYSDLTEWCRKAGGKPVHFYPRLLAFFICYGILFENFVEEGSEGEFVGKIVRPAFERVTEHFGVKPLIVRLIPKDSETKRDWGWYPGRLETEARRLSNGDETMVTLLASREFGQP